MSETPKIGQKPVQIPVSAGQAPNLHAAEQTTQQKTQLQQGDGMAAQRPTVPSNECPQPLQGAFRQSTGGPRQSPDLGGLDTDPKLLAQSTLAFLTAPSHSAQCRATIGQWVGLFE